MADIKQTQNDPYARDSFTLRRMTSGQVWALTIVSIAVVVGIVAYVNM